MTTSLFSKQTEGYIYVYIYMHMFVQSIQGMHKKATTKVLILC